MPHPLFDGFERSTVFDCPSSFFGYRLIMDVIWNVNIFLRIFDCYPDLAVM